MLGLALKWREEGIKIQISKALSDDTGTLHKQLKMPYEKIYGLIFLGRSYTCEYVHPGSSACV